MPRSPYLPLLSFVLSLFLTMLFVPTHAEAVRYIKFGNNGHPTSLDAVLGSGPTDWACTGDTQTGLLWEVKVNDPSHLRHMDHTYTWYFTNSPDGNPGVAGNTSTCGSTLAGQNCNTETYASAVNAAGLCGFTNWHVPTISELESLVKTGSYPAIDTDYFPHTVSSYFWSASPYAYLSGSAWYVGFGYGSSDGYDRSSYGRVRLARGGQWLGQFGGLTVTIKPAGVREAGAQWRIVGTEDWRDSGTSLHNVATGEYLLEFKDIDGANRPEDLSVSVTAPEVREVSVEYTGRPYTITFNPQGGTNPVPATRNVTFGSPYGELAQTSRSRHILDGWFIQVTGGTKITPETIVTMTENHTLHAQWTALADISTVTFDPQGGSVPDPTSKQVVRNRPYGELPTTTRGPGYTFEGWYTEPTWGSRITDGSTVSTAQDHTLYARWTPHSYTITFDSRMGSAPVPATLLVSYDQPYGQLPSTSRDGYFLAGWFTEPTGGTRILPTTIVDTDAERTLYAHWLDYGIVTPSAGNNGTIDPAEPQTVTYAETVTFTVVPDGTYVASVGGTCGGTLVDNTFTTEPIILDCTVEATFIPPPFPDTGQTKCYDNTQEITCPQPGQPFYGQDAQYQPRLPRSYTKLGHGGVILADNALHVDDGGQWIMTKDNVTGLIWELKTNANKDDTYTWQDAQDVFIPGLNYANFGGFSDWRLPSVTELSSLVNSDIPSPGPTIDLALFPNTGSSWYWSATTIHTIYAWRVNFDYGFVGYDNKYNTNYVRAVRLGQWELRSFDNLVIHEDGTFTDPTTGLMWQIETAPRTYTWKNALEYAENLQLAGYTDWRLPDRNELQSLVDYRTSYPSVATVLKDKTVSSYYWSSTTYAYYTYGAWRVYFYSGSVNYGNKSDSFYVRAVRLGHSGIGSFGSLAISIAPADAVAEGAQWRRTGTSTWRDSGATESNVPAGTRTVEFKDVDGWLKPDNLTVSVTKDQTTTATGTYTQAQQTGSISVTIGPSGARDAGAQWRRTGTTTWRNSGDTESGVPTGSHTAEFKDVIGWRTPNSTSVTVSRGETTTATGTYVINTYTVTFKDHDGTVLKTEQVNHGSAATPPADPTREGYIFGGWDTDFSNVTTNLTVKAQYRINPYTLTLSAQPEEFGEVKGGGTYAPDEGVTVTAAPNAEYRFLYWSEGGQAISVDSNYTFTITNDRDLVAHFGENFFPFPDTGQTKCYNNEEEITCPQPGQPFYGQDAQYQPRLPRSYTKLGHGGVVLADNALHVDDGGQWMMTKDNVTGLIWELKTNANKDETYTWQDAQDVFIPGLNYANFGGFSDWRMPSVTELSSLVNAAGPPWIDTAWFPKNVSSLYWPSTTYVRIIDSAFRISFDGGFVGYANKSSTYYVRAVRLGQPGLRSFDNLVIHGDGTFSDPTTGLMWQLETAPGRYTWENALQYVENLQLAGYMDWRLPNRNELQSLVHYGTHSPAIALNLKENTVSSLYWSSTTHTSSTSIGWLLAFADGRVRYFNESNTYYVRAVRSGHSDIGSFGSLVVQSTGASGVNITANPSTYEGTTNYTIPDIPKGTQIVLTAPATSGGASFVSWNGCDTTDPADRTCTVTMDEDKIVTANYRFTVTFKDHDGTVLKTELVEHGSSATAPADPVREGHTFTEWDRAFDNVTESMDVTALYDINTYTVTFRDYDGTVLKTELVEHGSRATAPADPVREGHTFTEWDRAFDNVTESMDVTAQYIEIVKVMLTVYIEPVQARTAGAGWRIVGARDWITSGGALSGLPAGTYAVEFKDVGGWKKPANIFVTVEPGQTTQATGTYERRAVLPGVLILLLDDE